MTTVAAVQRWLVEAPRVFLAVAAVLWIALYWRLIPVFEARAVEVRVHGV